MTNTNWIDLLFITNGTPASEELRSKTFCGQTFRFSLELPTAILLKKDFNYIYCSQ